MPMVVYWRLRYACAPCCTASAISCMRELPAGFFRIQPIDSTPYNRASTALATIHINCVSITTPCIVVTTPENKTATGAAAHLFTHCQPTLESGAGLEPEYPVKLKIPDELIDRILSMLTLHLGQDQLG